MTTQLASETQKDIAKHFKEDINISLYKHEYTCIHGRIYSRMWFKDAKGRFKVRQ